MSRCAEAVLAACGGSTTLRYFVLLFPLICHPFVDWYKRPHLSLVLSCHKQTGILWNRSVKEFWGQRSLTLIISNWSQNIFGAERVSERPPIKVFHYVAVRCRKAKVFREWSPWWWWWVLVGAIAAASSPFTQSSHLTDFDQETGTSSYFISRWTEGETCRVELRYHEQDISTESKLGSLSAIISSW